MDDGALGARDEARLLDLASDVLYSDGPGTLWRRVGPETVGALPATAVLCKARRPCCARRRARAV
ncbi:hypothetical protein [Streptomyces tremellae]|uniref:Uncharacterized protein n=1 Tax=Streptomyces tremellae TaxID=1124239 RepID=A0ABP7FN81_9ACTN